MKPEQLALVAKMAKMHWRRRNPSSPSLTKMDFYVVHHLRRQTSLKMNWRWKISSSIVF